MNTFRYPIIGLVFFSIFIGLVVNAHTGILEGYHITEANTKSIELNGVNYTGNIGDQFLNLNLISGIRDISNGLTSLVPSAGSTFDVVGGLLSIGIGSIKSVFGLLSTPVEILFILTSYYGVIIPDPIRDITVIITTIVGFLLISIFVGVKT